MSGFGQNSGKSLKEVHGCTASVFWKPWIDVLLFSVLGIDKFGGSIDGAVCLSEGIMFICESSSNIGEN